MAESPGADDGNDSVRARASEHLLSVVVIARNERERILVSAGGEAALPGEDGAPGPLLQLIDQYQGAVRAGEGEEASELKDRIAQALQASPPRLTLGNGQTVRIGGEAASVLSEARSYANEIEQTMRSERNTFNKLLAQYRKNPRILVSRIWQDVREKVFTGDGIETIYSMSGKPYIVVNRDPEVQRKREQNQINAQNEAGNNGNQ